MSTPSSHAGFVCGGIGVRVVAGALSEARSSAAVGWDADDAGPVSPTRTTSDSRTSSALRNTATPYEGMCGFGRVSETRSRARVPRYGVAFRAVTSLALEIAPRRERALSRAAYT